MDFLASSLFLKSRSRYAFELGQKSRVYRVNIYMEIISSGKMQEVFLIPALNGIPQGAIMDGNGKRSSKPRHDFSFASFIFSIAGWTGMESWLVSQDARFGTHVVFLSLGAVLTTISIRSCSRHRKYIQKINAAEKYQAGWLFHKDAVAIFLLIGIGFILSCCCSSSGLFLPFIATMMVAMLIPWLRFTFCNQSPNFSYSAVVSGVLIARLVASERSVSLLGLIPNWMLWTCACLTLLQDLMGAKNSDLIEHAANENLQGTPSTDTSSRLQAARDL